MIILFLKTVVGMYVVGKRAIKWTYWTCWINEQEKVLSNLSLLSTYNDFLFYKYWNVRSHSDDSTSNVKQSAHQEHFFFEIQPFDWRCGFHWSRWICQVKHSKHFTSLLNLFPIL
jgi:hypothetical protein